MNIKRIEEIQKETAYPDSISVQQALLDEGLQWGDYISATNNLNIKVTNQVIKLIS